MSGRKSVIIIFGLHDKPCSKMKHLSKFICAFFIIIWSPSIAQDSLFTKLAIENHLVFGFENGEFKGEGWDLIKENTISSKNVLVGEDHFSNEIPQFVRALSDITSFDNFYIEVDPYSTRIIERSLKEYSDDERKKFNAQYKEFFSFYALEPEYDLLKHISDSGANILGSDQVVMFADQLIFQDLLAKTSNEEAKDIYLSIMEKSRSHLKEFYEVTKNPMSMYFMADEFSDDLEKLKGLDLSEEEKRIIDDIGRSVSIYKEQSHRKRIKLILNQLMKDYPEWKDSKNLFKYGANHMTRGESFLTVYDVGNMVANITASNYEESFHIMILGESGMLGSPFKDFPPSPVDPEKGFYLSYLKPFFEITEGEQWHLFNLVPLRKMVERGKLKIENQNLLRAVKGYDALVIIPEVTAAKI